MAFDLQSCYGFGRGADFTDYEVESGEVFDDFNSYALNAYLGQFGSFKAGEVILIHASSSPTMSTAKLGKFICAKIEVANNDVLTLDKDISTTFSTADLADYYIQAVTFAEFHCLKIYGAVTPQIYSSTAHHGGIFAIKVADKLTLEGVIDLTDKGISTYQKDDLRPLTSQELEGTLDADDLAGNENYCINNIFPLNSGDGAAFIFAEKIKAKKKARIGNPSTRGKFNCRGAADSPFKPSNVTNVGGSSILIVAENKEIFSLNLAKYRTTFDSDAKRGKGLARCYIALGKKNFYGDNDDKLYHADLISDYARLSREFKVRDFGSGIYGSVDSPRIRLNSFAEITPVKNNVGILRNQFRGLAALNEDSRCVLFNPDPVFCNLSSVGNDVAEFYKPIFSGLEGSLEIAAMPEFENLTLTQKDTGNIFAVYVRNKFSLSAVLNFNKVIIFAKEIELSGSAKFCGKVMLCAEKITGDLDAPKDSLIFLQ